jgi:hypothetical protein
MKYVSLFTWKSNLSPCLSPQNGVILSGVAGREAGGNGVEGSLPWLRRLK